MSPETLVSETQRMRMESYLVTLSSLSMEERDMVQRAAMVGLEQDEENPRMVNIRHAVSHEFPVPQEVGENFSSAWNISINTLGQRYGPDCSPGLHGA